MSNQARKLAYGIVYVWMTIPVDAAIVWASWNFGVAPFLGLPRMGPIQALLLTVFLEYATGVRRLHSTLGYLSGWITGEDLPKPAPTIPHPPNPPFSTLPAPESSSAPRRPSGGTVN